jgi:hypothetical protein
LQSKNPKPKNGTEAAIPGVFAPRKLRKVKLAGTEAGCKDLQVFAKQKPEAQKWHGGRNSRSFRGAKTPQGQTARRFDPRKGLSGNTGRPAGPEELKRKPGFLPQGEVKAPR